MSDLRCLSSLRRRVAEGCAPDLRRSVFDIGVVLVRTVILALPLLFITAGANAEPTSTLSGMWQQLSACAQSVGGSAASAGSEVTVLFSIKRDGSLQGQPRITHSKLVGDEAAQKEFLSAALNGIARCFPLAITDGLGGAVAGRPLRLRVMNRPRQRGV